MAKFNVTLKTVLQDVEAPDKETAEIEALKRLLTDDLDDQSMFAEVISSEVTNA